MWGRFKLRESFNDFHISMSVFCPFHFCCLAYLTINSVKTNMLIGIKTTTKLSWHQPRHFYSALGITWNLKLQLSVKIVSGESMHPFILGISTFLFRILEISSYLWFSAESVRFLKRGCWNGDWIHGPLNRSEFLEEDARVHESVNRSTFEKGMQKYTEWWIDLDDSTEN